MATTTNYALEKPTVGGDTDTWGGKLNDNMDAIDTQMKANADAVAALGDPVAVAKGGTGSTTAAAARTALGLGTAATQADTKYAHRANNLSDLNDKPAALVNLGLGSFFETVTLGGNFTTNTVRCSRIGNVVTISATALVFHTNLFNPFSDDGVIPAIYRPGTAMENAYTQISTVKVSTTGRLNLDHRNYDGSPLGRTSTGAFTISYVVAP